jgi:chromosome segregation ATPase
MSEYTFANPPTDPVQLAEFLSSGVAALNDAMSVTVTQYRTLVDRLEGEGNENNKIITQIISTLSQVLDNESILKQELEASRGALEENARLRNELSSMQASYVSEKKKYEDFVNESAAMLTDQNEFIRSSKPKLDAQERTIEVLRQQVIAFPNERANLEKAISDITQERDMYFQKLNETVQNMLVALKSIEEVGTRLQQEKTALDERFASLANASAEERERQRLLIEKLQLLSDSKNQLRNLYQAAILDSSAMQQ